MPDPSPRVFLGLPNYGDVRGNTISSLFNPTRQGSTTRVNVNIKASSALTFNFNMLWAAALNARQTDGITHFAMLHADVAPDGGWLDVLLEELTKHNADVVSVVIPIKDQRAVTTTAIGKGGIDVLKRITVREARRLPRTFDAAMAGHEGAPLLINTGCWVADIRKPWAESFPGFTVVDGIFKDPQTGEFGARFFSEDWYFGLWLHQNGLKAMATTAVGVGHWDCSTEYRNDLDWGLESDPTDGAATPALPKIEAPVPVPVPVLAEHSREPKESPNAGRFTSAKAKPTSREIVVVRFATDRAWLHNWLDELLISHGPDLTYRIYDKGPGGDTENVGNLDGTYLHHIVTRWDELADWTVFTQDDPEPHLVMAAGHEVPFASLFGRGFGEDIAWPFMVKCREWGSDGRLCWDKFPPKWKRAYETGAIRKAELSLREWMKEYIGVDLDTMEALEYHPGAIFGVSRETIRKRPKAFYERLLESLTVSKHPCPEESHYAERSWSYIFSS